MAAFEQALLHLDPLHFREIFEGGALLSSFYFSYFYRSFLQQHLPWIYGHSIKYFECPKIRSKTI